LALKGTNGPGSREFLAEIIVTSSTDYFFFMNTQMQMPINKRAIVAPIAITMITTVSRPSLLALAAAVKAVLVDVESSEAAVESPYVKTIEAHFMEAVSQS